ncbi:hypothetical protein NFI96_006758 [Prochilodus magdalenae]|nr:hypothetical protein NFI96_006758 [Prochilodus magdalenae]
MHGCEEYDDGTRREYDRYGYDGEDLISLDLNTGNWTAANAKAVTIKQKWEETHTAANVKAFLLNECPDWLEKYVGYGRSTLERKVHPETDLFQKNSSSPVVCHATGFFPKAVMISWKKNGEDLDEDMELRETLLNQDGTFQKRSILTVSPEELDRNQYACIIQHSSLEKEMVLQVSDRRVLSVPPEVSLFQKDSSSPVVCHATGFYPKPVNITWQKNGEDLYEGVELRETLPNQDGTFQRRSILTVSPEELDKHNYTCIIQHSSLEKEMVLQVSDHRVLSGGGSDNTIIGTVMAVLLLVIIILCVGVFMCMKNQSDTYHTVTHLTNVSDVIQESQKHPHSNIIACSSHNLKNVLKVNTQAQGRYYTAFSSSSSKPCNIITDGNRTVMEVNSVNSSLTITAVQDSDSGLYYCSSMEEKHMIFSTTTYLHIRERNQVFLENPDRSKEAGSPPDVLLVLTLVFVEAGSPPDVLLVLTLVFVEAGSPPDVLLVLTLVFVEAGSPPDVLLVLTLVFVEAGSPPDVLLVLTLVFVEAGSPPDVLLVLTLVFVEAGSPPDVLLVLTLVFVEAGSPPDVLLVLTLVFVEAGSPPDALLVLTLVFVEAGSPPDVLLLLTLVFVEAGSPPDVLLLLTLVFVEAGSPPDVLFVLTLVFVEAGSPPAVLFVLTLVFVEAGSPTDVILVLTLVFVEAGSPPDALLVLTLVFVEAGSPPDVFFILTLVFVEAGSPPDVFFILTLVFVEAGSPPDVFFILTLVFVEAGSPPDVLLVLTLVFVEAGSPPDVFFMLTLVFVEAGSPPDLLLVLTLGSVEAGSPPDVFFMLTLVFVEAGSPPDVFFMLTLMFVEAGSPPDVFLLLTLVFVEAGSPPDVFLLLTLVFVEAGSPPDVLLVLTLVCGGVIVVLLSVLLFLLFIILKYRRYHREAKHSLRYFYTGVTPGLHFTLVGLVDGEQFVYYDSNIRKMIPKTDWIKKIDDDDPQYWDRNTQWAQSNQEDFKISLDIAMQLYNHKRGVHTVQRMYGCELGDDGNIRGYDRYGYDGEDFFSLDLNTGTWTAANAEAVTIRQKWEKTHTAANVKAYLENECPQWLQKYVGYGGSTPERKGKTHLLDIVLTRFKYLILVPPEVSLFQKNSSSAVCHATGFYPKPVNITWKKNGEDLYEGVELRETLPNQNGTFQRRSILTVSPEELNKHNYTCIIQHISLEKEVVLLVSEPVSSSSSNPCYFITGSNRAVMEVNSMNSSLTITAVQDSDSGLYYCSRLENKYMIYSPTTYLHIRDRKQIPQRNPDESEGAGSPPEVFTMLTLLFGAMVAVLLSALLILIFIRQSERKDQREQQRGVKPCYSITGSNRAVMEVNSVKSSLTITAVQDSDSALYYCCVQKEEHMTFSTTTYLQVRERSQKSPENADQSKGSHSLQYLHTAVTRGINFPEYTVVGLVDGEQFSYYDSDTEKMIPKTEWMEKSEGEEYWNRETEKTRGTQETFTAYINTLMQRFNQTGVHTFQWMYSCELDDDGSERGYMQYGYDGEDFLSLDLNTVTWTAANAEAVITKRKWDGDYAAKQKEYLSNKCIDELQKYVGYGRSTLERKVPRAPDLPQSPAVPRLLNLGLFNCRSLNDRASLLNDLIGQHHLDLLFLTETWQVPVPPEVSLFQKNTSSPVVCHATGFYPKQVNITWQKNGEDLDEGVELRETLPNLNGTFQKRSILTVSPEELNRNQYTCVVQHGGLEKEMVLQVSDHRVLSGGGSAGIIVGVIVGGFLLVIIGCVGVFIWKKKQSAPVYMACKFHSLEASAKPCYFMTGSPRAVMEVNSVNSSLTITAVQDSDSGLYYCSRMTGKLMIFSPTTYLHIREQISSENSGDTSEGTNSTLKRENKQRAGRAEMVNYGLLHIIYNYFYTAVTPGLNFPEFTAVGLVDGEQFMYYDSNTRKVIPKTEWMEKTVGEDYWNDGTQTLQGTQEVYKVNVATIMQRFNQTTGIHTLQRMYGCELNGDGTPTGHRQYGYDGEDFLSLDLNTLTWTAANAKAVITKQKWERQGEVAIGKAYLENECIDWLEKYVGYGRSTLERKVPPQVSLFQKDTSSPVVCHATGFYPKPVMISWKKNGEDLNEGVELRETLPNQDRTFQRRSVLTVSPEELDRNKKYTCVLQHCGLQKEMVLQVSDRRVLTGGGSVGMTVGAVVAGLLLALIVCMGLFLWKKQRMKEKMKSEVGNKLDHSNDRTPERSVRNLCSTAPPESTELLDPEFSLARSLLYSLLMFIGKFGPTLRWKMEQIMKSLVFLAFTVQLASAGSHSLQYFYTAVTKGIDFPEFTVVGLVDGEETEYYDSNIGKMIPKTEWINKIEGEDYWNTQTQTAQGTQESFKVGVGTLMQRFNQTTGECKHTESIKH